MAKLNYKIIVSDFDGTLADWDRSIPAENIKAIQAYTEAGGIFTVSTGRMHNSLVKQLGALGLKEKNIPLISYQGALVTDSKTGEKLRAVPMKRDTVRKILRYCKTNGLYCHFYSFEKLFVEKASGKAAQYAEYTEVSEYMLEAGDLEVYMDAHPELEICKTLIIDEPENIDAITDKINAFMNGEVIFMRSAPILTECVDLSAGKGNAITWLSEHYNIPVSEIIAVGDAGNDEPMIRAAGLGVAMANAPEKLKKLAGYVTDDNHNAGVAKLIYKVLNGEL